MNTDMKFCKGCNHFKGAYNTLTLQVSATCSHPENMELDMVNGEYYPIHQRAELRLESGGCGKEGRWFEVRQADEQAKQRFARLFGAR